MLYHLNCEPSNSSFWQMPASKWPGNIMCRVASSIFLCMHYVDKQYKLDACCVYVCRLVLEVVKRQNNKFHSSCWGLYGTVILRWLWNVRHQFSSTCARMWCARWLLLDTIGIKASHLHKVLRPVDETVKDLIMASAKVRNNYVRFIIFYDNAFEYE